MKRTKTHKATEEEEFKMDENILDALRQARQSYLDIIECDNAIAEEQGREPKPQPCPTVEDSGWVIGGILGYLFAVVLLLLTIPAFGNGDTKSGTSFASLSIVLLVFGTVSLIKNSKIKKKIWLSA